MNLSSDETLKWFGRMSTVLMLMVLGWLGANIYWRLSAPESVRPSAQMETDAQRAQQAIAGRHLFGVHVLASTGTATTPSDIKLNGAIAADKPGQRAYALLSIEGKPSQLVREGEDLAPGITLQRVETRQVSLLRGGQTITLRLPETGKPNDPNKPAGIIPAVIAEAPPNVGQPATQPSVIAPPKVVAPPPVQAAPAVTPSEPSTPSSRRRNRRSTSDDS
jgi:hypothetical protein